MQAPRTEQLAGGAPPPAAGQWPPPWSPPREDPLRGLAWPPTADQLDYMQKAIVVALLLFALPALVMLLARSPERLMTGLARKHVG